MNETDTLLLYKGVGLVDSELIMFLLFLGT